MGRFIYSFCNVLFKLMIYIVISRYSRKIMLPPPATIPDSFRLSSYNVCRKLVVNTSYDEVHINYRLLFQLNSMYIKSNHFITGCPQVLRTDAGIENSLLARIQPMLCHEHTDSFSKDKRHIYGHSTSNQVQHSRYQYYWIHLHPNNCLVIIAIYILYNGWIIMTTIISRK